MTIDERTSLIEKYKAGYDEVLEALKDFPTESLSGHPLEGKWSAAEIVHHLADSESTSGIRLRRLLVEENPRIEGYDQEEFAIRLKYNEREIGPSLQAFQGARASTAQLLVLMSEEDWKRTGEHSESGRYSTEDWLRIYADHAHNHAMQIRRLHSALNG